MKHSSIIEIKTLGIDLAKNSFALVGANAQGKIVLSKALNRSKLLSFVANLPRCLIGMEACSGAHYWAREFVALGHEVGIMASKFVTPYRSGAKNDCNDAKAICEAVRRPHIWFVPVKTPDQQAVLCLHRIRQGLVQERTALINQCRGLLSEFGIVVPQGRYTLYNQLPDILEDGDNGLPPLARTLIAGLHQRIGDHRKQILACDRELRLLVKEDEQAKRLMTIPGVGEQVASGVVASVSDPRMFRDSRQFAAWLGLVPRQYSTGGQVRLGRITKQGDKYLRMCLVHGARAVVANLGDKTDRVSCWLRALIERRGYLRAVVALAARNARLIWTLMVKEENYRPMSTQS